MNDTMYLGFSTATFCNAQLVTLQPIALCSGRYILRRKWRTCGSAWAEAENGTVPPNPNMTIAPIREQMRTAATTAITDRNVLGLSVGVLPAAGEPGTPLPFGIWSLFSGNGSRCTDVEGDSVSTSPVTAAALRSSSFWRSSWIWVSRSWGDASTLVLTTACSGGSSGDARGA